MEIKMPNHSIGTDYRWELPDLCPYCNKDAGYDTDPITFRRPEEPAPDLKVKCRNCDRAWHVSPTPVWKILQREITKS